MLAVALLVAAMAGAGPHKTFEAIADRCGPGFGSAASRQVSKVSHPSPDSVCFSGPIDDASGAELESALREQARAARTYLVVNSSGGDAAVGVRIGMRLAGGPVTVIVDGVCASSCANYLFVGAGERVILSRSLVAFHGGFGRSAIQQLRPALQVLKDQDASIDLKAVLKTETGKIEAGVAAQDAFVERTHVRPELFSLFENWNEADPAIPGDCKGKDVKVVVFSHRALRSLGLDVRQDGGPRTASELRAVLNDLGHPDVACFWDDALK